MKTMNASTRQKKLGVRLLAAGAAIGQPERGL
jgi:hypothetical protein